jgi:hypothetical protein
MRTKAFLRHKAALFLGSVLLLTAALLRQPAKAAHPVEEPHDAHEPRPSPYRREREQGSILTRSIGLLFVATVVFALGAALGGAFAAHADDGLPVEAASVSTGTEETTTGSSTETEGATATGEAETTSSTESEPTTSEAGTPPPPPPTDTTPADETPGPVSGGGSASGHHSAGSGGSPVIPRVEHSPRPPETAEGGAATIWLHRTLPDPTPPAKRLSPRFASLLLSTARAEGIRWWPILAVLRAHGHDGHAPAGQAKLERLAQRLAQHSRRLDAQERSLVHYNRAVGLRALVVGLEAAKPSLERRILRSSRISLTAACAGDLVAGRVDVRVLVVIRYLVVKFHQVTVSSLVTGHRFFARPHVKSAHVDGLAVDISALEGLPITGNQGIGGLAEHAVNALLRLPVEVAPQQIISLLGLGGASFPQADHYNHIHVGF